MDSSSVGSSADVYGDAAEGIASISDERGVMVAPTADMATAMSPKVRSN